MIDDYKVNMTKNAVGSVIFGVIAVILCILSIGSVPTPTILKLVVVSIALGSVGSLVIPDMFIGIGPLFFVFIILGLIGGGLVVSVLLTLIYLTTFISACCAVICVQLSLATDKNKNQDYHKKYPNKNYHRNHRNRKKHNKLHY